MSRSLLGLMVALPLPMLVPSAAEAGSAYDTLTAAQKRKLDKDGTIVWYVSVPDKPWPKSYVYAKLAGVTPEEAMAVFMDFNRHREYLPDVNESKITKQRSATDWDVHYELHVPILSDEQYTVRNRLRTYDSGMGYEMTWTKIKASSTKNIVGNVRFEPLGSGTLISYYNFVEPGRSFSGWVEGRAKKGAVAAVKAMGKEVTRMKSKDPTRLRQLVSKLRTSVGHNAQASTPQASTRPRLVAQ